MSFLERIFGKKRLDYKKRFILLKAAISGTMSDFYMAKDRETGQIVGLKILDPKKCNIVEERYKINSQYVEFLSKVLYIPIYIGFKTYNIILK